MHKIVMASLISAFASTLTAYSVVECDSVEGVVDTRTPSGDSGLDFAIDTRYPILGDSVESNFTSFAPQGYRLIVR